MRAHSHSARIRHCQPFSVGAAAQTHSPQRDTSHAAAGAATRDDASACRTSHMRQVGSRDKLRCPLVYGDFMGDFRGVSDRAYPAALNTSHATMRHLMRHGGLGGGRRLRFAGTRARPHAAWTLM